MTGETSVERQSSLANLGSALRQLQDVITGNGAPVDALDEVSAALHAACARLTPYRREITGDRDHEVYVDAHAAHTLTPPFEILDRNADSLRGTVRFGLFYRNAFGIANGGAIALMFDTAMASLGSASPTPAKTANLRVDFRRGVPIDTDLTVLAQRTSTQGRKHELSAQLFDGDVLLSEASCLMIDPRNGDA